MSPQTKYEEKAAHYAEKHRIIKYRVDGREMKYQAVFPLEGTAYNVTVNLETMIETKKEIRGITLKHIMKPYKRKKGK